MSNAKTRSGVRVWERGINTLDGALLPTKKTNWNLLDDRSFGWKSKKPTIITMFHLFKRTYP